jgi:hypothetical protein
MGPNCFSSLIPMSSQDSSSSTISVCGSDSRRLTALRSGSTYEAAELREFRELPPFGFGGDLGLICVA